MERLKLFTKKNCFGQNRTKTIQKGKESSIKKVDTSHDICVGLFHFALVAPLISRRIAKFNQVSKFSMKYSKVRYWNELKNQWNCEQIRPSPSFPRNFGSKTDFLKCIRSAMRSVLVECVVWIKPREFEQTGSGRVLNWRNGMLPISFLFAGFTRTNCLLRT